MDVLAKFPRKLAAGSKSRSQVYAAMPDRYAVHRKEPETATSGAEHLLGDGKIAVFKGEPASISASADHKLSAVYTLNTGGTFAVPTGLVFVRLTDGVDINEQTKAFADAGYEVTERLAYAPNAAWLQARSGDIADGLNGIAALEKLSNVESVEPQMLMESVRR